MESNKGWAEALCIGGEKGPVLADQPDLNNQSLPSVTKLFSK